MGNKKCPVRTKAFKFQMTCFKAFALTGRFCLYP